MKNGMHKGAIFYFKRLKRLLVVLYFPYIFRSLCVRVCGENVCVCGFVGCIGVGWWVCVRWCGFVGGEKVKEGKRRRKRKEGKRKKKIGS